MNDPIYCTGCWNGDCELHPSVSLTDDSTDVGPAIKDYTIQEKRHEKELTKFKTERDALKKRCTLQLETIRELRDRLHNSEAHLTACRSTNTELRAKLEEGFVVIKSQRETSTGMVAEIQDLRLQLDLVTEDRQVEIETRQRLQVEHALEVNRLTVDNDALRRDLYSVINERDQAWDKIVELRAELQETKRILNHVHETNKRLVAELDHATEHSDLNQEKLEKAESDIEDLQTEVRLLRENVGILQDQKDHAVEVKNRCVATINKLCTQVVELQAQLKGKE